ncbi:DNA-directed RNA polymerase subunit beta [Halobacillus sp. ACCC02827]|uniref:DNA-directed RNA polymerase subunit beta n=1 Tax=Halobacillus sp. ACCC02827 TaxID=3052090 RepID=UPI0025712FFB|nr:DNA-directed RNA polymerase subunit beta [Halobacillus sp. ACCC02827]WJE15377.1 DNA-directed RNA polymerase subunit beta [Halobacillus sp. ACCC02827]
MATDPKAKGIKQMKEKETAVKPKAGKNKPKKEKTTKKPRRRILPIWLRILIVLLLSALALLIGLMVGYGVIGDGDPTDALKVETWQHIWDIVTKTE